jgi:fatty acid kinase fatty acid binding subunit
VRAIDSGTVSAGLALLARVIQERLERGTTDDEVDALVERFQRESRIVFTVDTLEFLAKGGRIGKAAAMAGTLLNIKPILAIERGEVVPLKRVRGAHKAFLEFVEAFEHGSVDRPTLRAGIAHADARDRLEALRELVRRTRPQAQVEVETTLGAVVGTHAGPGAVGLFWFDDAES